MKSYTVVLSPDPEMGGYVAIVPSMPGALTEGESRAEAIQRIGEVMATWLEVASKDGYAPREESPETIAASLAGVLQDRSECGWDWAVELVTVTPPIRAAA